MTHDSFLFFVVWKPYSCFSLHYLQVNKGPLANPIWNVTTYTGKQWHTVVSLQCSFFIALPKDVGKLVWQCDDRDVCPYR